MTRRTAIVSALAVMFAATHAASAQRVRGTIRDSVTGEPVTGAVVWLADSADGFLARSIGDEAGRFAVMRILGTARLHAVRIGFRPVEIRLDPGKLDSEVTVRMISLPLSLAPVEASSHRVCPGEKGTGQALDLWGQARTGLLASVVAREAAPPRVKLVTFTRAVNPKTNRATISVVRVRSVVADRSYVAARPPWAFAEDGYMHEDRGGDRTFYAPDEDVLLDPTFAATHCLRVVAGRGSHNEEIGIAFEPVHDAARDTLVDVTGVLWLARGKPELRSLEFRYTNLEPDAGKVSGGEIVFRVMPNGAPMIERWGIRSAVLTAEEPLHFSPVHRRPLDRSERTDVRVTGLRDVGGNVASAQWADGRQWHSFELREVAGQLLNLDGTPVAGARVWLGDTPDTATTDAKGHFALPDIVPGRYAVMAADSTLARVGVSRSWSMVDVSDYDSSTLLVFYASVKSVVSATCRDQAIPAGSGVLFGRVVEAGGVGRSNARVDVTWKGAESVVADSSAGRPDRTVYADEDGRFAICGAPMDRAVQLHASGGAVADDPLARIARKLEPGNQIPAGGDSASGSPRGDQIVEWKGPVMVVTIVVR